MQWKVRLYVQQESCIIGFFTSSRRSLLSPETIVNWLSCLTALLAYVTDESLSFEIQWQILELQDYRVYDNP